MNTKEELENIAPQKYYVYVVNRSNTPIYVGKGRHQRAFYSMVKYSGDSFDILIDGLSDIEALGYEKMLIRRMFESNIRLKNKQKYNKLSS